MLPPKAVVVVLNCALDIKSFSSVLQVLDTLGPATASQLQSIVLAYLRSQTYQRYPPSARYLRGVLRRLLQLCECQGLEPNEDVLVKYAELAA